MSIFVPYAERRTYIFAKVFFVDLVENLHNFLTTRGVDGIWDKLAGLGWSGNNSDAPVKSEV